MVEKHKSIHPIGDISYIHMMLTAESGWGKTVFLGTHPKVLLLLTDPEGSFSAKRMGSNIDEWTCHSKEELDKAHIWLRDGGHALYDVVAIDNISHAQKLHLRAAKIQSLARQGSKADAVVPEQGDYLRAQLGIDEFVLKMHDLPMHVVWTAWQEEHEDREGNVYFAPNIQGSKGALAQQIMGYMNINAFGQMVQKDGVDVRRLWFTHHDKFRGKDRFVALGRYRDNMTLPQLLDTVGLAKKKASSVGEKAAPIKRSAAVKRRATTKKAV